MTETEWLRCADPLPMLEFLRGRTTSRKLRLFAIACCHSVWGLLPEGSREAVSVAERFADGLATLKELADARGLADNWAVEEDHFLQIAQNELEASSFSAYADALKREVETRSARLTAASIAHASTFPDIKVEDFTSGPLCDFIRTGASILRDIFGDSFRPVADQARWLTPAVLSLARHIYGEKAFDRLPVLADALEEAGCTDHEVLAHCRRPATHVRGCWVVDALLGDGHGAAFANPEPIEPAEPPREGEVGMMENEWLTCTDPAPMLELLRGLASERKLRLFVVACCRRIQHLIVNEYSRTALEVAERFADGAASLEELRLAADAAYISHGEAYLATPRDAAAVAADYASVIVLGNSARYAAEHAAYAVTACIPASEDCGPFDEAPERVAVATAEQSWQAEVLRDLFGNPFRSPDSDLSRWPSGMAALARRIYEERAFDRMQELAEALEQAGFRAQDVVGHCRGSGPHTRGCWVLDLILAKR